MVLLTRISQNGNQLVATKRHLENRRARQIMHTLQFWITLCLSLGPQCSISMEYQGYKRSKTIVNPATPSQFPICSSFDGSISIRKSYIVRISIGKAFKASRIQRRTLQQWFIQTFGSKSIAQKRSIWSLS